MSQIKVLLVPVEGPVQERFVNRRNLSSMQNLVGGFIEAIGADGWSAYCDEEGKIKGLPVNRRATALAFALGWVPMVGDMLVGPVVFTGPADRDGFDTGVRPFVTDLVAAAF